MLRLYSVMNISSKFNKECFQNRPSMNIADSASIKSANPYFGAYYGLRGTPSELNQIIDSMSKTRAKFQIFELLNNGSKKMIGVLTENTHAPANLKSPFQYPIEAEDILDSTKLVYFNPITSIKREIKKFQKNGLEFIGNVSTQGDGILLEYMTDINIVNFPVPMSLRESIQKLSSLGSKINNNGESFGFHGVNISRVFSNEKLIEKCQRLVNSKIQGLKGSGQSSIAFLTDSNKVFKASISPNTPEILKNYDVPVFDRKQISKLDKNEFPKLYCVMQKNGRSWVEEKIMPADEEKLLKKIFENGDSPDDYYIEQIAKIDGEPYLIDSPAVTRDIWGWNAYFES